MLSEPSTNQAVLSNKASQAAQHPAVTHCQPSLSISELIVRSKMSPPHEHTATLRARVQTQTFTQKKTLEFFPVLSLVNFHRRQPGLVTPAARASKKVPPICLKGEPVSNRRAGQAAQEHGSGSGFTFWSLSFFLLVSLGGWGGANSQSQSTFPF